jgi:hypothetical protein
VPAQSENSVFPVETVAGGTCQLRDGAPALRSDRPIKAVLGYWRQAHGALVVRERLIIQWAPSLGKKPPLAGNNHEHGGAEA